ncbi:MAG: two-component system response regulator [Desulfobacterales bacterium CG07_land_8_20_14_0_80_52_14]|nr:MAG: two-component system response regulator [Desulfobacterales bacterium CG23_combo_of_CG06-09_8_20_14_all_52_9]PIU50477.1 MAG: two-component system response regulator [Desulfobacterales bacterium CG07_land_8_20_14_0_80_52_14]
MNKFKVLVVDDEEDFLAILVKRLSKRGVTVFEAKSGDEALSLIGREPIDVVVLDVRMPGLDGIETLKAIKQIDPSIEVIMLTGHANVEVAVKGMELGAFDYLMKPMNIDDLLFKLQDANESRKLKQQGHRRNDNRDASET